MKINIILILTCITLLNQGCYHEDKINTNPNGYSLFEFPQGNATWDEELERIYNDYGVKIINRNITNQILNRAWTQANDINGDTLTKEHVEQSLNFIVKHIFGVISPKITKGVLPPYIFITRNTYTDESKSSIFPLLIMNSSLGIDFWIKCMEWDIEYVNPQENNSPTSVHLSFPTTRLDSLKCQTGMICKILQQAINKGVIETPEFFSEKYFDYKTKLKREGENYYLNRGFPGDFIYETLSYRYFNSQYMEFMMMSDINSINEAKNFLLYLCFCLRYANDSPELEEYAPQETYPMLHSYRKKVQEYMLEKYDLDLDAIASGKIPNN